MSFARISGNNVWNHLGHKYVLNECIRLENLDGRTSFGPIFTGRTVFIDISCSHHFIDNWVKPLFFPNVKCLLLGTCYDETIISRFNNSSSNDFGVLGDGFMCLPNPNDVNIFINSRFDKNIKDLGANFIPFKSINEQFMTRYPLQEDLIIK